MRVLFIYPDILRTYYYGSYYHGIGYLSAVLKMAGHSVSLIHLVHQAPTRTELLQRVFKTKPDLVAISATTNQFLFVKRWLKWLKEADANLLTVCGGIHPTLNPQEAIATDGLDIICRGEGEEALVELVNRLDQGRSIDDIANLWIKKSDGSILRNPLRPLTENLDTLPFPDREIFDFERLYYSGKAAVFMASRGCPYACSYCCNHALAQLYSSTGKQYVRFRSVDNLIQEIGQALGRFRFIKHIEFDDDILPLRQDWFLEFTSKYASQIGLPFTCNMRPNLMNEEVARLLKVAGCSQVRMGIESGNEYIMSRVLNRSLTRHQILRAFRLCKEAGLPTSSYNMIGLPFENWHNVFETISLNADCETGAAQSTVFYPYRNTVIYDICSQNGLLTDKEAPDYLWESVLNLKSMTQTQLAFLNQFFPYLVWIFKVLRKIPIRFHRVLRTLIKSVLNNRLVQYVLLKAYVLTRPIFRILRYQHW